MPAPSLLATRLANELVLIGKMYGFQAEKESPIEEKSLFRIDVLWKIIMPAESLLPDVNVASIEIQYSDSPTSVSHNIFKVEKTLHPAIHVAISFSKLSDDFKNNVLKPNYPRSGLVIIDGEEKIRNLNLWVASLITMKSEETKLFENGKRIKDFAFSQLPDTDQSNVQENIRDAFRKEIEEVFIPPEITSLIESFVELDTDEYDRSLLDTAYNNFIEFVQSKMKKYSIPRINIPRSLLFADLRMESGYEEWEFYDYIEINQNSIYIISRGDVYCKVIVEDGNAYIISEYSSIMCIEMLTSTGIIDFIKEASETVETEIRRYVEMSEEDKNLLNSIIERLQ